MIIEIERAAVFADGAHSGVVETGIAIASYFQRNFHIGIRPLLPAAR